MFHPVPQPAIIMSETYFQHSLTNEIYEHVVVTLSFNAKMVDVFFNGHFRKGGKSRAPACSVSDKDPRLRLKLL